MPRATASRVWTKPPPPCPLCPRVNRTQPHLAFQTVVPNGCCGGRPPRLGCAIGTTSIEATAILRHLCRQCTRHLGPWPGAPFWQPSLSQLSFAVRADCSGVSRRYTPVSHCPAAQLSSSIRHSRVLRMQPSMRFGGASLMVSQPAIGATASTVLNCLLSRHLTCRFVPTETGKLLETVDGKSHNLPDSVADDSEGLGGTCVVTQE